MVDFVSRLNGVKRLISSCLKYLCFLNFNLDLGGGGAASQ